MLVDSSNVTNSAAAGVVTAGYWDTHWYYSYPGSHSNADGVLMGGVGSSSGGPGHNGLIFIR